MRGPGPADRPQNGCHDLDRDGSGAPHGGTRVAPAVGDRFQLDEPEFEADVFTVSDMTVEPATTRPDASSPSTARRSGRWTPSPPRTPCGCRRSRSCARCCARRSGRSARLSDTYEVEISIGGATLVFDHRRRPTPTPSRCWSCCAARTEAQRRGVRPVRGAFGGVERMVHAPACVIRPEPRGAYAGQVARVVVGAAGREGCRAPRHLIR